MSLTNDPCLDRKELIRTFTNALCEPSNDYNNRQGDNYLVFDGDDDHEDFDDNDSQSFNPANDGSCNQRKTSEEVSLLGKWRIQDINQRVVAENSCCLRYGLYDFRFSRCLFTCFSPKLCQGSF